MGQEWSPKFLNRILEIRSTKSEIRNNVQNSNDQNSKHVFRTFKFRIWNLFRISIFEFRIFTKEMAKKKTAVIEKEVKPKLRIKLRAYDNKIIDNSAKQIIETALRYGIEVLGPVPLPTEIHKYTVNRSSFIHKDAREQFELRVHKRLIDILAPNPKIIEAMRNLTLPAGVDIEIKI